MVATDELIRTPARPAIRSAKVKWVMWWALCGSLFLGAYGYAITRWLLGGFAKPVPVGPDEVPTYMLVAIYTWIAIEAVLIAACVYFFLYKPWRRDRRIGLNGLLVLAMGTVWMQDPNINYGQMYFNYNAHIPNLGCPQCFVPGWQGPKLMAEGLFSLGYYSGLGVLAIIGGSKILTWMERRWPRLGSIRSLGVIFCCAVIFDILTEFLWVRPGVYVYTGAAGPGPVLFGGHYYQLPLLEILVAGTLYTSWVSFYHFRNDKGETIAERGLDSLRGSRRSQSVVRFLALTAAFNVAMMFAYNVPFDWVSQRWNNTAEDVYSRSYLTGGVCGKGTQFACPDSRLPMRIGEENLYVTPAGDVVSPKGFPNQLK